MTLGMGGMELGGGKAKPSGRERTTKVAKVAQDLARWPASVTAVADHGIGAAASASSWSASERLGLSASSTLLHAGGMVANDLADRKLDETERPGERPIGRGDASPRQAAALAAGLTAAGIGAGALVDGRRGAARAAMTAGTVMAYDFGRRYSDGRARLSDGSAATLMAACRFVDALSGAKRVNARALLGAALLGAHTYGITRASQKEVTGGDPDVARQALRSATGVTVVTGALAVSGLRRRPLTAVAALWSLAEYYRPYRSAAQKAIADPTPANTGNVVGTGMRSMLPLSGAIAGAVGSQGPLIDGGCSGLRADAALALEILGVNGLRSAMRFLGKRKLT